MNKLGRNYALAIDTINIGQPPLSIIPPITVEFDIQRNYLKSANTASIRIYNLSEEHRSVLRKDVIDTNVNRVLTFTAGYGLNLATIFIGNISQCWSVRQGVNFITQVECYDAGFAYSNAIFSDQFSGNFQAGTPIQSIINSMIGYLGRFGIVKGIVGSFPGTSVRGTAYSDSIIDQIDQLATNCFFIDNQVANCINRDEVFNGNIRNLGADAGLLGTPVRQNYLINFDMIFEPRLKVGQLIYLESVTDKSFNGDYKIISLNHHGMISPAVSGEAITSVGLQQSPNGKFKVVS